MMLRSQAAGFWLVALALAATVIFKDSSIELFDAGRLLNELAHPGTTVSRRRLSVLAAPFYVFCDVVVLMAVYFACAWTLRRDIDLHVIESQLSARCQHTSLDVLRDFVRFGKPWSWNVRITAT
jgi:hypothetical protein